MARRGRRCAVEGCWRRAISGRMVCKDHEGSGLGKEMAREVTKLEREVRSLLHATTPEERRGAAARFRQKVERGDFAALFAGRIQELFEQGDGKQVFEEEIGALRVAMMRLLLEENDPVKLAMALSRVTNATVRAARAQEEMNDARPTAAVLERSLEKLEAAAHEMTEDELLAQERREWVREVGWTKEDEAAWYTPENQRRVLNQEVARRIAIMKYVGFGWQRVVEDQEWCSRHVRWDDGSGTWEIGNGNWEDGETGRRLEGQEGWEIREEAVGGEGLGVEGTVEGEGLRVEGWGEEDDGEVFEAVAAGEPLMLSGPEEWDLPDLSKLEGKALQEAMEELAWGPPGAYQEALRRAAAVEGRRGKRS